VLLAETFRSSTLKLALICIVIFGAVVMGLFGYVYWSTASYVLSRSDQSIEAEHALLRATYDRGGDLKTAIEQRMADARFDGFYLLADAAFTPVAGNLSHWPPALAGPQGWNTLKADDWTPDKDEQPLLRARFETLPDGFHLLVGREVEDLGQFATRIYWALALALSLILVLAVLASIAVTRRTVGRIEAVNSTSRAIMESGLGTRIPLRGTHDEWDRLAENLNLMLDRIEALMGEVRQVSDNVAHDLRTPLTRMRGRLEKASSGERAAVSDQSLISDTIADLDDVLRMFSSLTRISQIEAGHRTAAFRSVDLAEIAREVVELFDAAAEQRGGRLSVAADQPVLVTGDRDLLFDAAANLVDNAIKHGREGGHVVVAVTANGSGSVISVSDDGPGVPVEQYQRVFRRFYRLEGSRCTPGNGLGLSLVAAVVRLHGARVELVDNAPGLKVEIRFPAVDTTRRDNGKLAEVGGAKK